VTGGDGRSGAGHCGPVLTENAVRADGLGAIRAAGQAISLAMLSTAVAQDCGLGRSMLMILVRSLNRPAVAAIRYRWLA